MTRFTVPAFAAFPEPSDPVWASLDRYLVGAATPADLVVVEQWCAGDAERRAGVDAWGEAWRRLSPMERTSPEALQRIADQILAPRAGRAAQSRVIGGGRRGEWGTRTLRGFALSLSVATVLGALFLARRLPQDSGTTHTYATHPGQQAIFSLRDGTRVTLAPQTTLRIVRFGIRSRTVELDGQAYFEVARSAGIPFVVQTGDVSTQVLGTAFLVRRYANDDHAHVAVAEGKVQIVSRALAQRHVVPSIVLTAGHIGDVRDSTILVHGMDDVASETGWLRGQLVFRDATVNSILQTLSRWYGYQFRYGDPTLAQEHITAALDARSSMAALASLGEILDVHLTVVGDTVTLTQQPNQATTRMSRKQTYDVWIPTREAGK